MSKGLMKCVSRGALGFALCLLPWSSPWAAPICPSTPESPDPYQATASLATYPYTSVREFVFTVIPDGASPEFTSPSPIDIAGLTAAESGPPAASLLLIGGAMIWIAGVIRYSLKD